MARTPKTNINPELLIWARKSIGYSVEDAAKKLRVDETRVEEWEAGHDSPTVAQLRKIAERYKRPLAVFFLPEPPRDFQVPRDFRRLPGHEEGDWSPELRLAIVRAQDQRESALELAAILDEDLPDAPAVQSSDDPDAVAAAVRDVLGVTLEQQVEWRDPRIALRSWIRAVENAGVLVLQAQRIDVGEMRGFSLSEDTLPVVVLNSGDSRRGRIFTLLHEFAHIVRHTSGVCDLYPNDRAAGNDVDAIEVFCNQVAAATLLPRDAFLAEPIVQQPPPRGEWSDLALGTLADRFSVSREVILRRLLTLQLTTRDYYMAKRAEFIEEYKEAKRRKQEGKKPRVPYYRLKVRDLSRRYVETALDAYHSAAISTSEAADYLDVKVPGIEKLEEELLKTGGADQ